MEAVRVAVEEVRPGDRIPAIGMAAITDRGVIGGMVEVWTDLDPFGQPFATLPLGQKVEIVREVER